jgi:hypothetical protein
MMRTAIALTCIVALVVSVAKRADADDRVAGAVALWREGRALLQQKRYAEACDRFTRSQELDPSAGALFNLGDCNEKQGKIASAWSAYTEAETLAASKPGSANQQHAKDAHDAAERLLPRLSRLQIVVDIKTTGMAVSRNGRVIEPAALNVVLPVDAGPQAIAATAPDHRAWTTTIEVVEGATTTVHVPELEALPKTIVTPHVEPTDKTRSHMALGLEIGGGALTVAGLAFGGIAISKWSSVTDECQNAICRSEAIRRAQTPDRDSASTFATVSTIGIGVGLVALAVGVVLQLTAPSAHESRAR